MKHYRVFLLLWICLFAQTTLSAQGYSHSNDGRFDYSSVYFVSLQDAEGESVNDAYADTEGAIGAFVGDELRGVSEPVYVDGDDGCQAFFVRVWGDDNDPAIVTFRMRDASNGLEYQIGSHAFSQGKDATYGMPTSPISMTFAPIEGISLSPTNFSVELGKTDKVLITHIPEEHSLLLPSITTQFVSSNENILTVSSDGTITGKGTGTATLTANILISDQAYFSASTTVTVYTLKISDVVFSYSNRVLTMSCNTEGINIHYTLDGSTPTASSPVYAEPLTMTQNCTVRAIAMKEGMTNSEESFIEVGGLTMAAAVPTPVIGYEGNVVTIAVPAISETSTDVSDKVAVEPSSWGGAAPTIDLSGEWTCAVLNNSGDVTETYIVTLDSDGKAYFPGQAYVDGSWSYGNNGLSINHYRLLSGDNYQYDNYSLTTTTPNNPVEFNGTRRRTVGNAWTENNSQTNVRLTYNGSSFGIKGVETTDGREAMAVIANEGNSENNMGILLQQTITGLENGYYTVELFAKSCYSSAPSMATDVTYLFANDVKLFIPLEADKAICEHNVYLLQTEVSDGTLRLGLGKEKTGANWHAIQIRSLKKQAIDTTQLMAGAAIHYTLDGTTPTTASTLYTAPFVVDHNCIVKVFSVADGWVASGVASFDVADFKVADVTFSYASHILTLSCATDGATIHYTMDGTTPTTSSPVYTEPLTMTENCTVNAFAVKQDFNDSEVTSKDIDDFKVADVTFEYTDKDFLLTLKCSTDGAAIHYTTDGATPTEASPVYTAPLEMTADCTVKAIGTKAKWNSSEVTSYTFKINEHTASMPVIARNGNVITITQAESLPVYYTTDGTTPTTASTLYTAPFAVDRNCTVKAFSVADGWVASEVASFDVADFRTATPEIAFDYVSSMLTISCATPNSTIYYGLGDEESETEYTEPLTLTDNRVVRAWAEADGFNRSDTVEFVPIAGEELDVATSTLSISGLLTAEQLEFIRKIYATGLDHLDLSNATLNGDSLSSDAFAGMDIVTLRSPKNIVKVGDGLFSGCRRLAAVVWNSDAEITEETMAGQHNPNLLLYTNEDAASRNSGVKNRVVGRFAREITLEDVGANAFESLSSGVSTLRSVGSYTDGNFYCPEAFAATRISYSHLYSQTSGANGECRGWETLALPFTVQSITHRVKGAVSPFGSTEATPHFWLCKFGEGGFSPATVIEANHPYIICMPQNEEFASQYCLGLDTITFSATSVEVPVTEPQTATAYSRSFTPVFTATEASDNVFAINVGQEYNGYTEGSAFVKGLRAVRPFEAYTSSADAGVRIIKLFADDEAQAIATLMNSKERRVKSDVYDLQGRHLDASSAKSEERKLNNGIYITIGSDGKARKTVK